MESSTSWQQTKEKMIADEALAVHLQQNEWNDDEQEVRCSGPAGSDLPGCVAEPTAVIDEDEAARVQDEQWASGVERLIAHDKDVCCPELDDPLDADAVAAMHEVSHASDTSRSHKSGGSHCSACVLSFHRHPKEFTDALVGSPLAAEVFEAGHEVCPDWACGAKVLLPATQASLEASLEKAKIPLNELRPWHVIVKKEDVTTVDAVLRPLGRKRPKMKDSPRHIKLRLGLQRMDEAREADLRRGSGDDSDIPKNACEYNCEVKWTFIHFDQQDLSPRTVKTWPV